MTVIPDPPLDERGDVRVGFWTITVHLGRGTYGLCVMCGRGGYDWWDLTLCDMPPVIDRRGQLTDQVPMHPGCVDAMTRHWAIVTGKGGDDAEGDFDDEHAPEEPAPVVAARTNRAPTGAYARRAAAR